MALSEFCNHVGLTYTQGRELLSGTLELNENIATQLEEVFGCSKHFWVTREAQYREDLVREIERSREKAFQWMNSLPLRDMVRRRWISPHLKGEKKLEACLNYFGVNSYVSWKNKYEGLMHSVAFRTSNTYDSEPESVISWLRQAELQVEKEDGGRWDRDQFALSIQKAKELTLVKDPRDFLPSLRELLMPCGVSIAVSPVPSRCRTSGAVFFVSNDHAVILLSFRYLSDDQFWFTFFHECGHLLLHSDKGLFLEGNFATGIEENEANEFASTFLIPIEFEQELCRLTSKNVRGIYRFARKLGISPGIVVGQLQHRGIVHHRHLNKIKTRYQWN